ncbi:hypothetical protein [Cetobacterium sp. SF1]|uniref:hypothetical protein n=1 Tax=unclassified Cetobacterium TaxID=2630983 RepID=UPI003CF32363
MDKNAIKVIKFLVSGKAYSDTAIMKNIGIDEEELKEIYIILEKNGYLQSYEEFKKYNQLEDGGCSTKGGCCGSSCSSEKKCCSKEEEDYSNIKVITQKALIEFE